MNIRQRIQRYAAMRRAMRELGTMDDRLLSDIGVSRSQIKDAVFGR